MKKVLIGCINNNLRRSNTIKTRFFLIEGTKVKEVTQKICKGAKHIAPYKYSQGLACYPFGCGLAHYLQNDNLEDITTLDLTNTRMEILMLNDLKHILKLKNAFDENIENKLMNYVSRRSY